MNLIEYSVSEEGLLDWVASKLGILCWVFGILNFLHILGRAMFHLRAEFCNISSILEMGSFVFVIQKMGLW